MKKNERYILIVVSILLIIMMFHDEYGIIFSKVLMIWTVSISVYLLLLDRKRIHDKK